MITCYLKSDPRLDYYNCGTALGGYANLRPAKAFAELIDSSPLRQEVFEGTDLLIVRELLGRNLFWRAERIY